MSDNLPVYPEYLGDSKSWKSVDIIEQYAKFDSLLSESEKNSLFDALPDTTVSSQTNKYNQRGKVIAERLWLLGYLDADDAAGARETFIVNRSRVLDAVGKFQKDAGLTSDHWPGVVTWNALNNLVSFESDSLEEEWFEDPKRYPAVLRAAQCRLNVLGLTDRRPDNEFQQVEFEALKKFKLLVLALKAVVIPLEQYKPFLDSKNLDEETLKLLLDQDRLIEAAARANKRVKGTLYFKYTQLKKNWPNNAEIRSFLLRLIQIEFWLMGYDIDLMSRLSYPFIGFDDNNGVERSKDLKKYLEDFARLTGKSERKWSKKITPELFIELHKTLTSDDHEDPFFIADQYLKSKEQVDRVLIEGQKLHLRLWDGITRVFRWIGELFKKAAEYVLDITRSIARFFHNNLQKSFDAVKKAVNVIIDAMGTLDGSVGTPTKGSFVKVSADGDILAVVSTEAGMEDGLKRVKFLRLDAERFCLAARLCALVLTALINSVFARWASLAMALYSNLKECLNIINKIYDLEKEIALLKKVR